MRDRRSPLTEVDIDSLAWDKMDGLIPALVQDVDTGTVLMLAYMNQEALGATLSSGFATFFSRQRQRLWQKGETSGNCLKVEGVYRDCDDDALLVLARPQGPTCHLGTRSCFEVPEVSTNGPAWLATLSTIIHERARSNDPSSYTIKLLERGPERIAQKIGEEGVEVALAAVRRDGDGCAEEIADLIYHLGVLMEARRFGWNEVIAKLRERHASRSK
jgi:phosphoribosyl-ATP pyrophosphohydrolase/phosphoribosyl-AMP cyclohydrolase